MTKEESMKMEFTFIGNEKDKKTEDWGLKRGETYRIDFSVFSQEGEFLAFIHTPNSGLVACPYSSLKTFKHNWE